MMRKLSVAASRNLGVRLARWAALALAGITGGMVLGEMAVGTRLMGTAGEHASYSRHSANPRSLVPQGDGAAPCTDCADSYGVAAQLRAHRDARMSNEFRKLGAVDIDPPILAEASDDYRYGGRFPDPEPDIDMASEGRRVTTPAGSSRPAGTAAPEIAEY